MPKRKNMAPHPSHTDLDSCKGLGALQEPDDHQPEVDITDALSNPNLFSLPESHPSDADDDDDECFIRASAQKANFKAGAQALKSRSKKLPNSLTGGGSFQSLGLHPALLRAILLRGFSTPTPIQRAILPHILASPPRDVVGMARTGSGKTLAYLIPLIHNLGGFHSIKFGARALVMVPTRELAVQVLKVGKDLAKGFVQGAGSNNGAQDGQAGKAEGLRWGLVVGGDSLEDQFAMFASNPDVIIATPGRLLHLAVEMNLDLRSVTYVVFDEADRLFEMGFATQLQETLHRLPASRQTLLFSATLPKSLVEFAKAGLENPKLVRLDSEAKISADLQMAFLSVKPVEKEAALLVLIGDVIGVPKADGTEDSLEDYEPQSRSDRHHHRTGPNASKVRTKPTRELAPHQTIVFAATKHHVEYLGGILAAAGYRVSLIYGALDQAARRNQLNAFRAGRTSILVVTDLAARGLDIPILENVVNYDFPSSARAFVHRVGRTARAGRKGWAYSLVTRTELAYLMDLQLFLSRPLLTCPLAASKPDLSASLVLGTVPRERLDAETEYVRETLVQPNASLVALGAVVKRAQKMYEKSQSAASSESYRRAKALVAAGARLSGTSSEEGAVHVVFGGARRAETKQRTHRGVSRDALLAKVNAFSPAETVFEIGTRGKSPAAQLMRERRKSVGAVIKKTSEAAIEQARGAETGQDGEREGAQKECAKRDESGPVAATEGELEETFEMPRKRQKKDGGNFRDPSVYLGYEQAGAASERGYALHEGTAAGFAHEAGMATFDLGTNDEGRQSGMAAVQKASQTRWDRKTKKFVKIGQVGGDNVKLVKTESGAKLPASFRSGAYEEWKKKAKVKMPHVGDEETAGRGMFVGRRYRHEAGERRVGSAEEGRKEKVFKKTPDGKKKFVGPSHAVTRGGAGKKTSGKGKGRPGQHIRNGGLKTVQQIQKQRALKEKRTQRSNQPSRRKK